MQPYLTNILINLLITIFVISCSKPTEPIKPTPPPLPVVEEPILTLEFDDAHCTEAWFMLKTEKLTLPAELTIKQFNSIGDSVSQLIKLITKDTLVYIDSLYPNQTYRYQVTGNWYPKPNSQRQVTSNNINVKTMDTTSHNFTFEMVTFGGEISTSILYDVAIINENNIWAVGEIWIKDTSTLGYTKYNAVHWDGSQWELKRLLYNNSIISPIRGILVINTNDIYLAAGSVYHWNGISASVQMVYSRLSLPDPNGTIEKLWGNANNNIYGVGNVCSLIFYNGVNWNKITSETTLNINDIWGDYNPKTNEWEILAVASNYGSGLEKEILQIKNNIVIKNPISPQMWPLLTTWFKPNRQYYVAGAGIYQKRILSDSVWLNNALSITEFATTSIRGTEINDVFGVGAFGDFVHFNGVNWKSDYQEPLLSSGSYGSVKIKENLIIATGYKNREAVVLIGRRQINNKH